MFLYEVAGALAVQAAEIERLRAVRRWNIERADGGDVLVCRGEHDRGEKCQYERWVPATRADALAARGAELEAAREDDRAKAKSEGAIAGWNACRRSIYAVCEDVDKEAEAAGKHEGEHALGYSRGMARAAKSIARGFGAMEAEDDDNLLAALQGAAPADEGEPRNDA